MIANIEEFVRYIPTARGTYFEDIEPFLQEAKMWAEDQLFGVDIVAEADNVEADEVLSRSMNSVICLKAYASAIPFLDVVQTKNGFAVVNSQNHAPASKERVERLLKHVKERLYFHVDSLIDLVAGTPSLLGEWKLFPKFNALTDLLYWSGNELTLYCADFLTQEWSTSNFAEGIEKQIIPYLELQRLRSRIKGIQNEEIAAFISRDYLDKLIENRRQGSLTSEEERMLERLKSIVALFLRDEKYKAEEQLKGIVNMMIADLPAYPEYADSEEYKIKIAERYQNQQEDPTFFFM